MIRSLTINGLKFKCKRFNIFIGKAGTGKSKLLRQIADELNCNYLKYPYYLSFDNNIQYKKILEIYGIDSPYLFAYFSALNKNYTDDNIASLLYYKNYTGDTILSLFYYESEIEFSKLEYIVMDNPENDMSLSILKRFAENIAQDTKHQYFITTHSPFFFDCFFAKAPSNEIMLYQVYLKDAKTKLYRIPHKIRYIDDFSEMLIDAEFA